MSASAQAVDQFLRQLRAGTQVKSARATRAAVGKALLDLDEMIGNPAWTDGCDVIGTAYERAIPGRDRRRLGQFFTPIHLGRVMARWVLQSKPSVLLDPGCGSGSLLIAAAHENLGNTKLFGLDIDPLAVKMSEASARLRGVSSIQIHTSDFLLDELSVTPDGIICNPPYTRHHALTPAHKRAVHRGLSKRLGIDFSQTSSLHVLFLLRALEVSSPEARLAFITPSHWLDKNYATAIKDFVLSQAHVESIVNIPATELVFDHAITTATITLIQKGAPTRRLTRFIESPTAQGRDVQDVLDRARSGKRVKLSSGEKWSRVITHSHTGPRLGELAEVHRGVATGCNEFFVISEQQRRELGIAKCSVRPCIPRPKHIEGALVTDFTLASLPNSTKRWLLVAKKVRSYGPLAEYLDYGLREYQMLERTLVQERLTAGREWYQINSDVRAPIVATYINTGRQPRIVRNRANAIPLNNWLIIDPRRGVSVEQLFKVLSRPHVLASFRQYAREYGKGMWKLEPSELADIRLPRGSIERPRSGS